MTEQVDGNGFVEIPFTELSPEALRSVIESFVLREGTDYGEHEYTLEQKVARVMLQLRKREARILWDEQSESITLVTV